MSDHLATIGGHTILEPIGQGGMAEVYRAQTPSGQLVCLKRVKAEHADDIDFLAAFVDELDLAKALRHPNIVRVYEWGQDDGPWFTMELIDGPNFGTLLERHGRLPAHIVAHIGACLAQALVYVHHRDGNRPPAVHCDVTPHNVLIDQSGTVKLADFGIAKALGTTGAASLTRPRGKAGYLAPEQLDTNDAGEQLIDSRVDLFTLGLVLWRGLIGTHPYIEQCPPNTTLPRWIPSQLRKNARRTVGEAAPTAPAGLCQTIEDLLQPLERRTSTAERVLAALLPHTHPESAADLGRIASHVLTLTEAS